MELSKVKLILSEIDGVVTEHLVGMGEMGIPMFKQFCMKDFDAINFIKKYDYSFCFLSSDAYINLSLCRRKNIPFFHAERSKKDLFTKILQKYNVSAEEVLYVGSSYDDISCMQAAGTSMCPEDAVTPLLEIATQVIPVYSGAGVLSYVWDLLYKHIKNNR